MRIFVTLLVVLLLAMGCARSQPTPTSLPTPGPTPTTPTAMPRPPTHTPLPTNTTAPSPTPTQGQPTPSPLDPLFRQILENTASIRGLEPLGNMSPRFMSRQELADTLREDLEEEREEVYKVQELLKILGLIPQDGDLYQMFLDLYAEGIVGFYDTETRELYVISEVDEITAMDELTLAHEYVHALQQQHFDIHTLIEERRDDSEAGAALDALIEGDATAVQSIYLFEHMTSDQRSEIFGESADSPVFDTSPYFLQQSLLFPYLQGAGLVNFLLFGGGWDLVNDAYATPPTSTEQVLHPQSYIDREGPVEVSLPDVAGALGPGWEEIFADVMGEFSLQTYLETRIGRDLAAVAADGWGGDRFTLLGGPQGERVLVLLATWDSETDAQQYFDTLRSIDTVPAEGYVGMSEEQVLLVISPSTALTEAVLEALIGQWGARIPD